jgi:hypothetical protein
LRRKKEKIFSNILLFKINYSADMCPSHQDTRVFSSWGAVWGQGTRGDPILNEGEKE